MTMLDLSQHPHVDLADLVPQIEAGETVEIWRDGRSLGRLALVTGAAPWPGDMAAFRGSLGATTFPGSYVESIRQDDGR